MRRSQSAVEATADYLGTSVAGLSYPNPGEANRNISVHGLKKGRSLGEKSTESVSHCRAGVPAWKEKRDVAKSGDYLLPYSSWAFKIHFVLRGTQQTMQDDLLMDKNKAQPHQQQDPTQVDPPPCTPTPSSDLTSSSSESESPSTGSSQAASALSSGRSKDRVPMESPILPGLGFHHPLQETGGPLSSPPSSFGSTWSTGTTNAVEDSFFQGIPSVNGTMLFQNFPHVNPVFGGNFSPQVGLPPQSQQHQHHAQQQQRRSPVSPSQGPFPQRNAYQTIMNNSKGSSSSSPASSSAWNNHQNAAWSTASNPWSGLQPGRDPRRAVGVGVGVGVPSPLNPISPMKKPYTSNIIAPPKFPRPSGPLAPKPWMEDTAFRTDNSNNILPFQVTNNWVISLQLHHGFKMYP
ncbi:hypothetical protein GOODEAATRI_000865 [Goodea atripinnis]|uniref:Uncharacterized protein n=1 Tax=Goodea atripinnis TaxID=208336 RepID=A0ABV0PAD7_9TELE